MNYKLPCEVIRDLFPSYIEKLTSELTNSMVKDHLAECKECEKILDAMQEPTVEPMPMDEKKEIDFLKKNHKKNRKIIWGSLLTSIAIIAIVFIVKFFFIGSRVYNESVVCDVSVDGKELNLSGVCVDNNLAISNVKYKEEDGVVTVSFQAVVKSAFKDNEFESSYQASEPITQVCLDERIIWAKGVQISEMTSAVYRTAHAYVGDMSENSSTANALNMANQFGYYKNALQTAEEPYGWTFILEDEIKKPEQQKKEEKMEAYAYVLLSVIGNLGEVSYEYVVDGEACTLTITTEQATAFLGQDIKACGKNVDVLQELIWETGID